MAYLEAFAKAGERGLIPKNYLEQGMNASKSREKMFRHLFDQRKLPDDGWDDHTIETLLQELASMDSNNFLSRGGVGEREGRIYSKLVASRNYDMSHGIGRSGDLAEAQPKAAGSTLLSSLTNALVLDLLNTFVSSRTVDAFVIPMATGMSIALCLLQMKQTFPKREYVVCSRIDQKSCIKAVLMTGLTPLIISQERHGDELRTNLKEIEKLVKSEEFDMKILCVITTTSCFAPRAVDNVPEIAKLLFGTPIFHLVNNAYGIQSSKCAHAIDEAMRHGKVDVYVQSTDKNLMVPVGGTIIAGFSAILLEKIRKSYPGRASSSQSIDVLITLLSMGNRGYKALLDERKENFTHLVCQLSKIAAKYKGKVLKTPHNNISVGMSLQFLDPYHLSKLGSMLFTRNVQGARVIDPTQEKEIEGFMFQGWGAHCDDYPYPYLTAAATVGMDRSEVDYFIKKLKECIKAMYRGGPGDLELAFNDGDTDDTVCGADDAVGGYEGAVGGYDDGAVGGYDDGAVGGYDDGAVGGYDGTVGGYEGTVGGYEGYAGGGYEDVVGVYAGGADGGYARGAAGGNVSGAAGGNASEAAGGYARGAVGGYAGRSAGGNAGGAAGGHASRAAGGHGGRAVGGAACGDTAATRPHTRAR